MSLIVCDTLLRELMLLDAMRAAAADIYSRFSFRSFHFVFLLDIVGMPTTRLSARARHRIPRLPDEWPNRSDPEIKSAAKVRFRCWAVTKR